MKKITKISSINSLRVLMLMALMSLISLSVSAAYTHITGNGTEADPYLISTADALAEFSSGRPNNDTKYYELTTDIDMSGTVYTNNTSYNFKGTFDGKNHIVSNLTITSGDTNVGFIGKAIACTVQNVGFENLTIQATATKVYAGGIIGYAATTGSTIENCFVEGSISTPNNNNSGSGVGALIGKSNYAKNTLIKNCYVDATIYSKKYYVGGFIGQQTNTKNISTCENCVFYGTVTDNTSTNEDPFVGKKQGTFTATNLYFDENCGNSKNYASATSLTTAQLSEQANYVGFDFTTLWVMNNGRAELQAFVTESGPIDTSYITYEKIGSVDNANNPSMFTDKAAVTLEDPQGDSTGYAFIGWYADASLTVAVNDPAIAEGAVNDTTFYAKWQSVTTSSVIYENMGIVANENNPTFFNDLEEVTLVVPTGDSTDYIFAGWFTNVELTDTVSVPAIATGVTTDQTFYAKWSLETYTIAYANCEGVDNANNPASYDASQSVTLAAPNTAAGDTIYTWEGWYTDATLSTPVSTPAIAEGSAGDVTFFAKWTTTRGKNLVVNGGMEQGIEGWPKTADPAGSITEHQDSIHSGAKAYRNIVGNGLDQYVRVMPGATYTFSVWGMHVAGTKNWVAAKFNGVLNRVDITSTSYSELTETFTVSDAISTAANSNVVWVWTSDDAADYLVDDVSVVKVSTTIKYDINDGEGTTPMDEEAMAAATISLPASNGFSKSGFVFDGWSVDAGTTKLAAGADYDVADADELVFVAQWIEDTATTLKALVTSNVSVYPNPSQGVFNIELNEDVTLEVFTLGGQSLKTQAAVSGTTVLDLSSFDSGLYLLTVKGATTSETIKLQVK